MERKRCTYCSKMILFAETVAGNRIPLDPDPSPTGNVVLERARSESGQEFNIRRARVLKRGEFVQPGAERYSTHFATCTKYPRRRKKDGPPPDRREPYAEEHDGS